MQAELFQKGDRVAIGASGGKGAYANRSELKKREGKGAGGREGERRKEDSS